MNLTNKSIKWTCFWNYAFLPGMYTTVWRFSVPKEMREHFEQIYGSNGKWAHFFSKSEGYIGTRLVPEGNEGRYLTIDTWTSKTAFEGFKKHFETEYHRLDKECESLTESETLIGGFEHSDPNASPVPKDITQRDEWSNIVNLDQLTFEPGAQGVGTNYEYQWAPSASNLGAKKLGFNVSILPPKMFSCPYHFHHGEEELFIVLQGKAILRQAGKFRELKKGDLIFFTTGTEGAHQFYNHTEQPCVLFALSNLDPLDICEYPDSRKINVRKLKKLIQDESEVEYLRDEEDPAKHWPKEFLK